MKETEYYCDLDAGNYGFIIDTDTYAGNFERMLTAYVTGNENDTCGGADELAKLFKKEEKINKLNPDNIGITYQYGEHGSEMCSICPTPGYYNDGKGNHFKISDETQKGYPAYLSVIIYFDKQPSKKLIEVMKRRTYQYMELLINDIIYESDKPKNILGFRLVYRPTTLMEIDID